MTDIQKELQHVYEAVSKEYTVFGVFLYGSQNYNLATEESDIDTKAIIIPSLHDLIFEKPVSKTVAFEHGECDIKDVREMISNYKKQNVNFVETLFTKHSVISPLFSNEAADLLVRREKIARYDEKTALACMNGLLQQSVKRMLHRTEITAEDIDKYGYHRKSLMNACKMADMINKYTKGYLYRDVLDCGHLAALRTTAYSKDATLKLVKKLSNHSAETTISYLKEAAPTKDVELADWLDKWTYDIIRRNMPL